MSVSCFVMASIFIGCASGEKSTVDIFVFFFIQIGLHVYPFEPDSAFTNEKDNNTGMSHSIRDRVWGWGWGYIGTSSSVLDIITTLILGSV